MEAGLRTKSAEADFWAGLFLDLAVRIEWLAQTLDSVPHGDASAASLARLRGYARALEDLRVALQHVHGHRAEPRLKPLFSLEGPLALYLSRLFGWCEEIGGDFERMAVALRRREPVSIVFSHRAINGSFAQFHELIAAMRRAYEIASELHGDDDADAWRRFDEHLEDLIWATEWVHMTLARRPGE